MRNRCSSLVRPLAFVFALAGAASAQVNLTAPAAPLTIGANIAVAGTGFPAGVINAASVSITVTPSAGNGSPVSFAPITVAGNGANRTLIFKLPPSLTANQPYTALIAATGQTTAAVSFTTATAANVTINPSASVANVSPGAGQIGTQVNVTITGNFTHFGPATSVVTVGGAGVTVINPIVPPNSLTQMTATFVIAANATSGPRSVTVTTGGEVATIPVGFVVTSAPGLSFSSITPNSMPQGATNPAIHVTGVNTHFAQGVTTANFGDGVTVGAITVNSLTDMNVQLTVDPLARTGGRMVTIVTGGEFATSNGFTVTSSGASIISATPNAPVPQGANATLTLTGLGTHWVTSGTTVSFGGGVNAGNVTVNGPTSLTVNISVGPGVPAGAYGVTTVTNGEVATLGNAVTVSAATPFLSGVAPTTGAQGANNIDVTITGTFTNFLLGNLSANFGPLITVNSVTATSATVAHVNISINAVAGLGGRSVTLTSNGALFSFNFSVTSSGAAISGVTPNSGLQQSSVALQVTGVGTHWVQGTTIATLNDIYVTTNRVIVNSPTSAEVDITLGALAGLGLHSLTMSTGGEVVTASNVFIVLPFTPSLSLMPSSGMVGTTINVNFNGNFTHFSNQTAANIDGQGVAIQNFQVTSLTTATAQFVINANAPSSPTFLCSPNNRTVTLTTGNEIVTAPYCVTSTPAVLTSISPYHSPVSNTLTVAIKGAFTTFTNAGPNPTTVGFGPNITVNGAPAILTTTSLTVNITVGPNAALGWRQAFVNTGTEQLSIGFLVDSPASATLTSVTPNAGQQGQSISGVTITGNLTNFVQGTTIGILGAGVTVSNLQVLSPTVATATVAISPTTQIGGRTAVMITGSEVVSGPLFSVNPGIATVQFQPLCNQNSEFVNCNGITATAQQGAILPFSFNGANTHFLQGETTVDFGPGIAITQLQVNSPTSLSGQIAVSYTAPIGFHQVRAITDGEIALANSDALNVIQTTSTSLNITPTSGQQGQHVFVQMNGSLTSWVNGTTVATFGNNNGLVVNAVNVTSATQAVIDLTIQGTAYVGPYSLTVTTNHGGGNIEQELLSNVFGVSQGAAIITKVLPVSAAQGSTVNVAITGQNTSWVNGVTTAYFTTGGCVGSPNPGVNVANVAVASPTSAALSVAIGPNAQTGLQTLCMATLGELVNFQNSFTITPGTPTLNGVTPVMAQQGTTATLSIIGQFTHWQPGVTTITFGQGITLLSPLTVTSQTAATASIAVDPLAYTGTRNVVLNTSGEIVQGTAFFTITPGPAILSSISPSTANQGTHILMQLNGQNTHWAQGLSQITINGAGYDITINGVQVQSNTTAVVDMNLSPTANPGVRTVFVSTAGENVALNNGFVVTGGIPSISSISPSSIQQGSSNVNVQISGIFTKWDATTQVSFGPNISFTPPSWTVNSNTSITAVVNVPNGAPLGLQTVTVQTGGQILTTSVNILSNAPPTPYISYEYPSVALVGQTLSVNLAGQFTKWLPGTTTVTFGAGIAVNNFQVTGQNSAIANIMIVGGATLGTRTVTLTTGAEVETTSFLVTVGTPAITLISPASIIQGQTLDVDIVGQYTTFGPTTVFNFGQGITINSINLFGSTAARVNISADITANLGGRGVTATTGAEAAFSYVGFSVTPSQATITAVTPNTAKQGESPVIAVTGFATNWTGATVFSMGGIGITNMVINSATSATLTLSIPPLAGVGYYAIHAQTGGESAQLNNAFVVQPGTPILVSATGASAQQGKNFSVGILGQLTSFVQGTTSVNLGNGVIVSNVNVTSANSITVTGSVDPLAFNGSRNVTVTTGAQTLVLFSSFQVTPGTALITQLTPNQGNQGATMNVAITGTNTHFTPNVTVGSFGQGISLNTLTINSFTSATANITIAANAIAAQNSVTLTTLGESATAPSAFTIVSVTPIIDFINPTSLTQGQTSNVTVNASFTNFVNGNTTANFGAGVTINSTTVTGTGAATVNVTVSPLATVGTRTVQLITNIGGGNQEVAIKANAFTVSSGGANIISAVPTSPATVRQNDSNDTIAITGGGTHFNATSQVAFCGGVTPTQINLVSATSLSVVVNVSQNAPVGACGVTVTTGGEIATGANLFNIVAGAPVITGLSPVSARQNDSSVNVQVTGLYTNFLQGTTTASFGAGITVNGVVAVSNKTIATVNITVQPGATLGGRTVTMITGAETASSQVGAFTVLAGLPQISNVTPNTGAQGATPTLTITGLFTNFVQGTTTVAFSGGGLTVGLVTVNGPTQITVPVTVTPGANATARSLTVTTGAESASLLNAFTVLPGAPTITQISPTVGVPNTPSLVVNITGQFTNFVNGTTQATFGPNISVNGAAQGAYGTISVSGPTTATATLAIDPAAPLGARDVTVKTGAEIITVNNGFTVQSVTPTAPTIISVSPASGATDVPLNTAFTAVFSGPVDPATVLSTNVGLSPNGCTIGGAVPASLNVDASGRILTLTPSVVLAVGTSYSFTVNYGNPPYVKDPSAKQVSSYCYQFTTGFATSNTGPTFVSSSIASGDANIGTNALPVVAFDKAIDPATQLAGLTIFAGATPVPGIWSYNAIFTQATFTPAGGFAPGTVYTINRTAALTDTVGNPLTNPGSIVFTTGAGADNVAPVYVSFTPIVSAVTGLNPKIRVVFSKPMNPIGITQGQFYLYQNDDNFVVPGTSVSVSPDRKTFTLNLPGPLAPATDYYWYLNSAFDQSQHNAGAKLITFSTGPTVDLTAPTVTQVSPPNAQTAVPVNSPIEIALSKPIDPTSVGAGSLTLTPAVAGAVTLNATGLLMKFTPTGNLPVNQIFTVNASGFADLNGNLVTPFSSTFTVSNSAVTDTTHGTFSQVPTAGTVNVPTNAVVVFTSSKTYNPATVNPGGPGGNVRLYDQTASTYISGAVSMNANFTSLTFTPSAPLEPSHVYCGYGGYPFVDYVYDLAGNLINFANQCFTAAAGADNTAPTVISVMPVNGASGIGPSNPVTVTFSKPMNPTTLTNAQNVAIYTGATLYSRSFSVSFDATTLTFNGGNLPYNTTFTILITPSVADLAGNKLASQFTSSFTTIAKPDVTAPTVTSIRPAAGATGVPVNTPITFYVSESLNPATVPGAIRVSQNGTLITGSVTFASNNQVITFTPTGNLLGGANMKVFFTPDATDNSGNPLTNYMTSFTVAPDLSATPATLIATSPAQNITGVVSNTVVDLQFSKSLNPATVNAGSFFIKQNDATPIAGVIQLLNNNTVIRFTPSAPLQGAVANSFFYRVHFENTIKDVNNLPIAGAADNTFYFYVNLGPDNVAPTVTAVAPTNNATAIGTNATIRVTFSKPMDPLTITPTTLTLASGATPIPYSATFDSPNTTLTIVSQSALPASSPVSIGLTAGMTDPSGNALAPLTSVFNTGAAPDFVRPTVISSNIVNGQTGVPVNSVFTLGYSKPLDIRSIIANNTVYLFDNSVGYVPVTLSITPDGTHVTLQPNANLRVNASYYVYSCSVQDLNGNTMNACPQFNFTTALVAPVGGPQVLLAMPPNGIQVPTNFKPAVLFDRPIDQTSLAGVTLFQGASPVAFTTTTSIGSTLLTLTPTALLASNLPFTLNVSGVKDPVGNVMAGTTTKTFTTGPSVDLVPPSVAQFSPQSGTVTGTHPVITGIFSERVNPLAVPGGVITWSFTNSNTGVAVVGASVVLTPDLLRGSIVYPGNLDPNTQYCVNTGQIYDLAGNAGSGASVCFTTSSAVDNTAPTVTSVTPPNGQTAVPVNTLIQVVLSKPVDVTTVSNASMSLVPASPGSTVTLSGGGTILTLTLAGNLAATTGYTLNVAGFKDLNGNQVTPFSSTFTTSGLVDNLSGTIAMTNPAPGSNGVSVSTTITATLSKAVDPNSVIPDSFQVFLNNNGSLRLPGAIAIGNGGSTLTFTPTSPLPPSTPISVYVGYNTGALRDLAGNQFNQLFNAIFTTASTPDNTPPTVLSVTPTNGASNVGPSAVVTLIFSKALDFNTINAQNFTLYNGFTNLSPSVTRSADNRSVTLTNTLPYSSTLTVTVSTNVKDLSGNSLATPFISTFSTETQPLTSAPSVSQIRPANGATGVPVNNKITLYFSAPLNPGTVPGAFYISQNGSLISGSVSVGGDNRSAVWIGPGFANSATIQVFFTGATDTSGNAVNAYAASFTTAANPSLTPAVLVSTNPQQNITGALTSTIVDLQFSKPLQPATVTAASFFLKQNDATSIPGTISLLNNNTVVRFVPNAPFAGAGGNTIYYRVHYGNAMLDVDGLPVSNGADNTFYFYVGLASDNTPPTVTSVAPFNGATAVGDNATVRFTFSEPLDTLSLNPSTVTLKNGAASIAYNMAFSNNNMTVTLSPQYPLPDNATLTLGLTAGIVDPSGNALTAQSVSFQTGPGADFTQPKVIYSSISNGDGVPANSSFTLVFNKPLDRNTVNTTLGNGSYYVYDNNTGYLPSTITVSADGLTVTMVPNAPLTHSGSIGAFGATDLNGNTQVNYSASFNLLPADVTSPQPVSSTPANTANGAPLNALIEVQFNEAIRGTSLSQITLMKGAVAVPFTASLLFADSTVHLTPANLLIPNTTYTVSVQGVQDIAGNTMTGAYNFTFTTGNNVALTTTPQITSVVANGIPLTLNVNSNNVPVNPTIAVVFDTPVEPASLNNGGIVIHLNNTTTPVGSAPILALSADQKTVTVTLAPGTLAAATQYVMRVSYAVRIHDWAGNQGVANAYFPFTTQ